MITSKQIDCSYMINNNDNNDNERPLSILTATVVVPALLLIHCASALMTMPNAPSPNFSLRSSLQSFNYFRVVTKLDVIRACVFNIVIRVDSSLEGMSNRRSILKNIRKNIRKIQNNCNLKIILRVFLQLKVYSN